MPYVFIIGLAGFLLIIDSIRCKKVGALRLILLIYLFVFLIVIGGLRDGVGFDFGAYVRMFNKTPLLNDDFIVRVSQMHGEIGFYFVNAVLKHMGFFHPAAMFLLFVIIPVFLNFASLKKYNKYYLTCFFLYICLYFFGREMGQIRMGLAAAICFFSIRYIKQKKINKYLITIILASLFHISSIVMIPSYFFANKEYSKGVCLGVILLGVIVGECGFVNYLIPILNNIGFDAGMEYFESEKYGRDVSLVSLEYARRMLPAILGIIGYNTLKDRHEYFLISYNILLYGVFISLMFSSSHIHATRLPAALIFNEIMIYSFFRDCFKNKYLRFFYQISLFLYGLIFITNMFMNKYDEYFPYGSFLQIF